MSNYNRSEHLKELHSKRKAITQEKVDKAIQRLIKAQKPINCNSVANESGITKKTLYNNKEIKEKAIKSNKSEGKDNRKNFKKKKTDKNKGKKNFNSKKSFKNTSKKSNRSAK